MTDHGLALLTRLLARAFVSCSAARVSAGGGTRVESKGRNLRETSVAVRGGD